jgi:hypothetical protein
MPDSDSGEAVNEKQGSPKVPPAPPPPAITQQSEPFAEIKPTPAVAPPEPKSEVQDDIGALKDREAPSVRQMVWLTGIIAFATIANVGIFYLESESTGKQIDKLSNKAGGIVDAMNQALSDNRDALSKAFQENRDALEASERQAKAVLDATTKAFRNDQRAWISAGANMISIAEDGRTKLELFLVNSGRTPGLDAEAAMGWEIRPATTPTGPPSNPNYRFSPQGAIAPQSQHPLSVTVDFAPYQSDIIAGRRSLVYFGVIRYHDIYGARPIHETHWCLAFTPGESSMRACLNGNDIN